ncbi:hypothetical protein QBC37DRAFT_394109 [Rhypophila decipiens]|uniref:Uncharacterized protein n=1 Tax=Rhypophila decipiens TaxID=261697 RepID=A0AAN6YQ49_9PEZI|nr:hypothetical protein QBC37DRAFT_394109 [Rhypophila decipiens]
MQAKFLLALMATLVVAQDIPAEVAVKSDASGKAVPFSRRDLGRRQGVPAEVATKSDVNGNAVPFNKREVYPRGAWKREPIAQIPAEVAVRSGADGIPVPFGRR